jgi:hypothetical protein
MKLHSSFSIHTVRTENANGYCEFIDINYRQFIATEQNKMAVILPFSKTRWLSILPAVEPLLKYFLG